MRTATSSSCGEVHGRRSGGLPALGPLFCFSKSACRPTGAAVFQPPKYDRRTGFGRLKTALPSIRPLQLAFVRGELWAMCRPSVAPVWCRHRGPPPPPRHQHHQRRRPSVSRSGRRRGTHLCAEIPPPPRHPVPRPRNQHPRLRPRLCRGVAGTNDGQRKVSDGRLQDVFCTSQSASPADTTSLARCLAVNSTTRDSG